MRGHGAGDAPCRGEGEGQQHHGAVDRQVRFDRNHGCGLRTLDRRQEDQVERQPDQDMRRRPCKAGLAPADGREPPRGQRPADGAGEAGQQGDAGDRAPRLVAIDAAERGEGGVVQPEPHAGAEQQPRRDQHRDRSGQAQHRQPRRENDVGGRQHLPAAELVDLPADPGPEQRRDHQRCRERREHPVAGNAEIVGDRIGEDGREIVARGPGQRLGGAQRQDEGKLARAHRGEIMVKGTRSLLLLVVVPPSKGRSKR